MDYLKKYVAINQMLNVTGVIWSHGKEKSWLQNMYLLVDGESLLNSSDNIDIHILRAGIIGTIYTEFCCRYVDEKGVCQAEGLIKGLEGCLKRLDSMTSSAISYLTDRKAIISQHKYVAEKIKKVCQFREEEDHSWGSVLFDELYNTLILGWIEQGFIMNYD